MSSRVILFNGPPRCGKDEAARQVYQMYKFHPETQNYMARIDRFSRPLKTSIMSWIGGDWAETELTKDAPNILLHGLTFREAQIDLSEKYIKPLYGNDAFGRWMVAEMKRWDAQRGGNLFLIPDSGFKAEGECIVDYYGSDNVLLVRIHRDGTDFSKDSRSYIDLDCTSVDVENNGTLAEYSELLMKHVTTWIKNTR